MSAYFYHLPLRSLIEISGPDRQTFLQGLVTNDVFKVSSSKSLYSALLSPQGKFLYDFFIFDDEGCLVLETDSLRQADLVLCLRKYQLRYDIKIEANRDSVKTFVLFGTEVFTHLKMKPIEGLTTRLDDEVIFVDPRFHKMGLRVISKNFDPTQYNLIQATESDYETHRLQLGIPEAGTDMIVEKAIPLEAGLDELNAIDWDKGCYMGQELTARTKYRGLVRKRLLPVKLEGDSLEPMTLIKLGDQEVGTIRSSCHGDALALLRLEALNQDQDLYAGSTKVMPNIPEWIKL